ncbi:MAG: hypothetical protein ACREH9_13225, partial [Pseudomonadota bacterium]
MSSFLEAVRDALRMLTRAPGFTAVAVLALALAIGANTAIFSLLEAVILKSFPFHDHAKLVTVWYRYRPQYLKLGDSPAELDVWRRHTEDRTCEDTARRKRGCKSQDETGQT